MARDAPAWSFGPSLSQYVLLDGLRVVPGSNQLGVHELDAHALRSDDLGPAERVRPAETGVLFRSERKWVEAKGGPWRGGDFPSRTPRTRFTTWVLRNPGGEKGPQCINNLIRN